ncbi:hypothetical protein MTO96_030921 [Rhipicephalus appendiculatus]
MTLSKMVKAAGVKYMPGARKPVSPPKKSTPDVDTSQEQPRKTLASTRRSAPRPPPLPADDYKIVLRIRGGLRCADIPLPKLIQAVLKAAALTSSLHDQYRINSVSNILLISTPDSERTEAYHRIKTIKMDERSFEVAPTSRIHRIPAEGSSVIFLWTTQLKPSCQVYWTTTD